MSATRRRPAILALDGGGSKVDAVLLSKAGTVLGAVRWRGSTYEGMDDHGHSLDGVAKAVAKVCADAGLDPERAPVADLGVYCLAGADLPADDRRILRGLRKRGFTVEDVLRNDTFAVLRAGTEHTWGVGVVCGSGTNCTGVAPGGRIFRFPAVGGISGDWGGGYEIGETALWHALRAEDGRGERTSLRSVVPAHFGLKRPRQVMEALYFNRMGHERVSELPPVVFRAAAQGDTVARSIVDRQAEEVVTMAGTAIRRLRMTALDVDVVLGGGIFRNRFEPFFEQIREGLARVAPRARVVVLTAPPVVGAALLALDRAGAPRAASRRVRATLTHERLTAETAPARRE